MINVKQLTITINQQPVLNQINCSFLPGHITSLIGPSGAGKTTFLKAIAGLTSTPPQTILINGQDLSSLSPLQRAEKIGYVFQDFNLFENLTVWQNCIDPLVVHGQNPAKASQIALTQLTKLGLASQLNKYPQALSGGQKQRVAIARALCLNPQVLLLDEPTASLDPANTLILVEILKELAGNGYTIVLSSQDLNFISQILDQAYYLENGQIVENCQTARNLTTCPKIELFLKNIST